MRAMAAYDAQQSIEQYYTRKIDPDIAKYLQMTQEALINFGVHLLTEWLEEPTYTSKQARKAQVSTMDLHQLVLDILVGTMYCQTPETFVSITSQLANRIGFDDKADSIRTIAEITAVLTDTDAYDIYKDSDQAPLMLEAKLPLPDELLERIERAIYLPPLIHPPKPVEHNWDSPYQDKKSRILGKQNAHADDICLEVLNIQNAIPLKLDFDLLNAEPEEPKEPLVDRKQQQLWDTFMEQSREVYALMYYHGNQFWLDNRVDFRGRIYSQGYHINPQGSAYKKAMVELYEEEHVTGEIYENL